MKISVVLASTTHLDRHYERIDKKALYASARKINRVYLPYLINHDFEQQIGVVFCAKVHKLPDGEYGLFSVVGVYESTNEKLRYVAGAKNLVHSKYEKLVDGAIKEFQSLSSEPRIQPKKLNVADLLAIHLDSTKVNEAGKVYKIKRFIASVSDLDIRVYPSDHPGEKPGHFHIVSRQRNIDARFNIDTLELINTKKGFISSSDIKKIQDFFRTRPKIAEKLRQEYLRLNP